MDDLKFPDWKNVPQDKPRRLSMDEYLEFVLFNWKNFPHRVDNDVPAPVRFVIREEDELFGQSLDKSSDAPKKGDAGR
jgi:hypothetical protein